MKTSHGFAIALLILNGSIGFSAPPQAAPPVDVEAKAEELSDEEASLLDGFDWLMAQQGADGGWHSKTYGAMRGGAALTSLVLYTASNLPGDAIKPHAAALRKGWAFLAPGLRGSGKVSAPDGESDFPTYAAGILLSALNRLDVGETPDDVEMLVVYLCRAQLDEDHGFEEGDPDFGGWDLMAPETKREGETIGTNVSVTGYAIEGLLPHRERDDVKVALQRAGKWMKGVQNLDSDGGFYFHPEGKHLGNKAGWSDEKGTRPRSYGTCTADGLSALANLSATDGEGAFGDRMKAAAGWLSGQKEIGKVPGFEFDPPESGWDEGLKFYYVMSLASALPQLSEEAAQAKRTAILATLLSGQSDEGGWANASARMREDDPIIATSFALITLGRLVEAPE